MLTVSAECTVWLDDDKAFCGRPTGWICRHADTGAIVDVLCDRHRTPASEPIPASVPRAPVNQVWPAREFDKPGAASFWRPRYR